MTTTDVRRRMLEGASRLLARKGLTRTSFREVIALTGAPRGSLYHHFPGGKEEMVGEAIDLIGRRMADDLDRTRGATAVDVTSFYLDWWRHEMRGEDTLYGCAIAGVITATDSQELLSRAAAAFGAWQGRLADLLVAGGLPPTDARRFATVLVAAAEGAVILTRAERDLRSFDLVADQLLQQAARLQETHA